jgi:hypothetical protein
MPNKIIEINGPGGRRCIEDTPAERARWHAQGATWWDGETPLIDDNGLSTLEPGLLTALELPEIEAAPEESEVTDTVEPDDGADG